MLGKLFCGFVHCSTSGRTNRGIYDGEVEEKRERRMETRELKAQARCLHTSIEPNELTEPTVSVGENRLVLTVASSSRSCRWRAWKETSKRYHDITKSGSKI